MSMPFSLTSQPIRVTVASRQPIYLALDIGGYDALDVEAVCAIEGTATNAALNLYTGMQTATDDGWVIPTNNFSPLSGTGQQIARVTVTSGLLQYLRWDVSSLGGASALTFFLRGVAREGGSAGAGGTMAASYAAGSSASDQTMLVQSGDGGPVIFKANGATTGSLLKAQTSGGTDLVDFNDNGSHKLSSGMADGASAVAAIVDTASAWTNAGAKLLSLRSNAAEKFYVSANAGPAGPFFGFNASVGFGLQAGNQIAVAGATLYPSTSNAYLGAFNTMWFRTYCYSYYSQSQAIAYNSTVVFDSTSGNQGEVISVTLTGNVTSWSITRSGNPGQRVMLVFVQDGTGSRTLTGAASNIKLAGGSLTLSTGANKRDTVVFMDDGVNWIEIARSLNN